MPFWMLISKIILVFISVLVQAKKVYAFNIDVAYTIFYISMVSPGEECRQHFMNSEIYLTISKYFPSGCQILEATPFFAACFVLSFLQMSLSLEKFICWYTKCLIQWKLQAPVIQKENKKQNHLNGDDR